MTHLIIALIAIALEAASLFALLNYQPRWAKTAPDIARVIATGISTYENAYYRYADAHGGALPAPTAANDGGLSQFKAPVAYFAFMPNAPAGFAWKYGQNGNHYLCLYPVNSAVGMPVDVYKALARLQRLLPPEQFVIHAGDSTSCGSTTGIAGEPSSYPASLSVTYFLKYIPEQLPASHVLPCQDNTCLSSTML